MADEFRFPTRPNRASEIAWRAWSGEAFADAQSNDRPILLVITTVWSTDCARLDEVTFSDARVISLIERDFVPIRVDADRYPHVQDRYVTAGWPTLAFLTPTGEVLWADTFVEPARLCAVADGVRAAWRDRREEFRDEVARRRRALESSRRRHGTSGLVRREAADDVATAAREAFDARNGGFGGAPKFPVPAAVELLYRLADTGEADYAAMADRTLDGMLAGELFDGRDGGFYRYALAEDWTAPRFEKLLDVNAAMLRAYALGAHVRGREDWLNAAERTIEWVESELRRPDGLWGGSLYADHGHDRDGAHSAAAARADLTAYTNWNAQWIAALADAGARLRRDDWVRRAADALDTLLETMATPGGLLYHYAEVGAEPRIDFLVTDPLEAAVACLAVAQAAARPALITRAVELSHAMEGAFWADDGGFYDRAPSDHDLGALRLRDRPFEANSAAARLLVDLALLTGNRKHRAMAETVLASLSPRAGRYGVDAAVFAIAVEEFFQAPALVVVVGDADAAGPLRTAALSARVTSRRVIGAVNGATIGTLRFAAEPLPAAFVMGRRGRAGPVHDADALDRELRAIG